MNHHQKQPKQPQNPLNPHHHQHNQNQNQHHQPTTTNHQTHLKKKNPPRPPIYTDLDPIHGPKPQHLYGPTMLNYRRSTRSRVTSMDPPCLAIVDRHRVKFERADLREGERESWSKRGRNVESGDRWLKRERERDDRDWGKRIRFKKKYIFGEREWE